MAKHAEVTVGTTPTLLYQSFGPMLESVALDCASGADVTLGDENVVAGKGPLLKAANPPFQLLMNADSIYGISASTAQVEVFSVLAGR